MKKKEFSFSVIKKYKKARLGRIKTSRGTIDTPAFMPVGTLGTVKGLFVEDIKKTGSQIIFVSSLILSLYTSLLVLFRIKPFFYYYQIQF